MNIPKKTVYFTFDDGPDSIGDSTALLLDVLKEYRIKALFCLLGVNAEHYPELVKRIHDEGHYIINHGYSDKMAFRMNNEEFRNNLIMGEKAISAALGFELDTKLYRPHGGFYKTRHENICIEEGYILVGVTLRIYDSQIAAKDSKKAAKKVIRKIEKQGAGLILLHDGLESHSRREIELKKNPEGAYNRSWIAQTVEEIIIYLLENGYELHAEMPVFN